MCFIPSYTNHQISSHLLAHNHFTRFKSSFRNIRSRSGRYGRYYFPLPIDEFQISILFLHEYLIIDTRQKALLKHLSPNARCFWIRLPNYYSVGDHFQFDINRTGSTKRHRSHSMQIFLMTYPCTSNLRRNVNVEDLWPTHTFALFRWQFIYPDTPSFICPASKGNINVRLQLEMSVTINFSSIFNMRLDQFHSPWTLAAPPC